jgi:hypothetical protein
LGGPVSQTKPLETLRSASVNPNCNHPPAPPRLGSCDFEKPPGATCRVGQNLPAPTSWP